MKNRVVVCVDARSLFFEANGISRYLRETICAILDHTDEFEFLLISNKKIIFNHHKTKLFKIFVDEKKSWIPGSLWLQLFANRIALNYTSSIFWSPAHVSPIIKSKRLTYVLTIHDVVLNVLPNSMALKNLLVSKLLFKASLKVADYLVCDSFTTKKDLNYYYPFVQEKKSKVIYHGKSANSFKRPKKKSNVQFLFVLGSLEPRKNIMFFLKVFEYILLKKPSLKLFVTGAQGWKNNDIIQYVKRSPSLKKSVILTGFLTDEEISNYFYNCEAFIFPSLYEGFGLPMIEAESKAVSIVSDIEVFKELGNHFNNINYCDFSSNTERCAKDILQILDNKNLLPLEFSRQSDRELFSWDRAGKEMCYVFSESVGTNNE